MEDQPVSFNSMEVAFEYQKFKLMIEQATNLEDLKSTSLQLLKLYYLQMDWFKGQFKKP